MSYNLATLSAILLTPLAIYDGTDSLPLPPYYPRTPAILDDWAATLDAVRITLVFPCLLSGHPLFQRPLPRRKPLTIPTQSRFKK